MNSALLEDYDDNPPCDCCGRPGALCSCDVCADCGEYVDWCTCETWESGADNAEFVEYANARRSPDL